MHICVVGLGNIGSNLYKFLLTKFPGEVTGVDVDAKKVNELQQLGYEVTDDYQSLKTIDTWLLTPSTGNSGENLFAAFDQMLIHPGSLISIESTLPPGTMERLEDYFTKRRFSLGKDLFLIHVPHRVMFGVDKTVCDTPRVIGAFTQECIKKGREFYDPLVPQLIEASDVRAAELSKIIENVKRYIDVAFAQEVYRYCSQQDINFESLRNLVNSKENVELLSPDWGIGGECLPKDMGFWRSVFNSHLLNGAEESDREYKELIIKKVGSGKKVLVKGLSFKPGVKDLNHSRGVDLVRALELNANTVWVEDPLFFAEELMNNGFDPFTETELSEPDIVLRRQTPLQPEFN